MFELHRECLAFVVECAGAHDPVLERENPPRTLPANRVPPSRVRTIRVVTLEAVSGAREELQAKVHGDHALLWPNIVNHFLISSYVGGEYVKVQYQL
jgi:hypothetical protein